MVRNAVAFVFVGLVTGQDARAVGPVPVPPSALVPPRGAIPAQTSGLARPGGPPEPLALPEPAGCMLRAAKSSAGVTLEIAPSVPYARIAQVRSTEVTLPIGRGTPVAGVVV